MPNESLTELYSSGDIAERVRDIAGRINQEYADKPLVMICVLKGAFMFFADLVRHINVSLELDFVRVASYGNQDETSGTISFTKDVEISLKGKDVLIVEDVVDSGLTMQFLTRQLEARGVNSLRIASLVDKVERRKVDVHVDYPGFVLSSGFIVGYGLDYAERYRELPAICTVRLEPEE